MSHYRSHGIVVQDFAFDAVAGFGFMVSLLLKNLILAEKATIH